MKKPMLALFVLVAIAVGALLILVVGSNSVERDGVDEDSSGLVVESPAAPSVAVA
jgi:hypothetical protein